MHHLFDRDGEERERRDFFLSSVQDSFGVRSRRSACLLSELVIDEKGEISLCRLKSLIEKLDHAPFFFWLDEGDDLGLYGHFAKVLSFFLKDKEARALLLQFCSPLPNASIEELIRYSLLLPLKERVTTVDVRRAVLSACLTPLRQNVGSCFATAPAILIQRESPFLLLTDLFDLLHTCRLTRTFSGVEHVAPISLSWGRGDLRRIIDFSNPLTWRSPSLRRAIRLMGCENVSPPQKRMSIDSCFSLLLSLRYLAPHGRVMGKEERALQRDPLLEKVFDLKKKGEKWFQAYIDHPLLKTWEFTLASFSDYKVEFSKWNLYASLGLDPQIEGGIGELLFEEISSRLEEVNREIASRERDRESAQREAHVSYILLRNADSSHRARMLKGELIARESHAQMQGEMAQKAYDRGKQLSRLFSFFIDRLLFHFPFYFQEIYDPDMRGEGLKEYEDSPAGFRLLYKHGRKDPSAWTPIYDGKGYREALIDFIRAIEPSLIQEMGWEDGDKEISSLLTRLIQHLREDAFLLRAMERMAHHHSTLISRNELDQGGENAKKPWSYTSGGTVHTLLKCYYAIEGSIKEEKKRIEHPQELLLFLLDTLKEAPHFLTSLFEKDEQLGLLAYSPDHVFILRPGLSPFKEGWLDPGFSYTWVRDQILLPGQTFYQQIQIDPIMHSFLIKEFLRFVFGKKGEAQAAKYPLPSYSLDLPSFRSQLLAFFPPLADQIDGFLRTAFPLFSRASAREFGDRLLSHWPKAKKEWAKRKRESYLTYATFFRKLLSMIGETKEGDRQVGQRIWQEAINLGAAPPFPLLFADTNWRKFFFGFVVHPGTLELDLWRCDWLGLEGFPMSSWKMRFTKEEKAAWGILFLPRGKGSFQKEWENWIRV